jgi:hypothetical protein
LRRPRFYQSCSTIEEEDEYEYEYIKTAMTFYCKVTSWKCLVHKQQNLAGTNSKVLVLTLLHKYGLAYKPTVASTSYFMLQKPDISKTEVLLHSIHPQQPHVKVVFFFVVV